MKKMYLTFFTGAEELCICVGNFIALRQVLEAYERGLFGSATTLGWIKVGELC